MATTLKTGSKGDEVKALQEFLISQGYDVGKTGADGIFGSNTAAAVKKFQQDKGLSVDGIVGSQTWGAINSLSSQSNSQPSPTSSNTGTSGTGTSNSAASNPNAPSGLISFTPLTPEEIRQQAENYYLPLYNAEVEALNQAAQRAKLAYQNQIGARQELHEQQKQELQTLAGQQRQRASDSALKRGLARSSIVQADLGRVDAAEMQSLQNLQRSLQNDINNIQSQIALLETQLADSLKRLDIDKSIKIQSKIDELTREQEQKQIEITQINNQYLQGQQEFDYRKERDAIADQQWQQQFDWNKYIDQEKLKLDRYSTYNSGKSANSLSGVDPYGLAISEMFASPDPYKWFRDNRYMLEDEFKNDPAKLYELEALAKAWNYQNPKGGGSSSANTAGSSKNVLYMLNQ